LVGQREGGEAVIGGIVLGVITSAILLKVVASILPNMEIEDWSAAIGLAFVMSLVATVVGLLYGPLRGALGAELWFVQLIVGFIANVIILAVAATLVPGVEVRGAGTAVLAALLLTALRLGVDMAFLLARESTRAAN
jgi:uncharacterized membrane protein YvlD (DUF360 family)